MFALLSSCTNSNTIKTLIITGQGKDNLVWMNRTQSVSGILDETGLFSTKILVTPPEGQSLSGFSPNFSRYKLVIIDFEGEAWPEKTTTALKDYIMNGGGVIYLSPKSDREIPAETDVKASEPNDFEVRTKVTDHPVTAGLPMRWLHPKDVIYSGLPEPGEDALVLATASSDSRPGSGRKQEPVMIARNLGKGRIFVDLLGTPDNKENQALNCAGYIVTLQRGAEWAATGNVTQEIPSDFPTAAGVVTRTNFAPITGDEAFKKLGTYEIGKSTIYFTWLENEIRKASGNTETLLNLEKKMVEVLTSTTATIDSKNLILKELSWMGSDYCLTAIKGLETVPELKDAVDFALERLQ